MPLCQEEKRASEEGLHPVKRLDGEIIDRIPGLLETGLLRELNTASWIKLSANLSDNWELVNSGSSTQPVSLSGLFAKWTPTPNGIHDKAPGIASLIHKKLMEHLREDGNQIPREEMLHSSGIPIEHLSLQCDVLTPLQRAIEIPKHFIGASTASSGVNYTCMATQCRMIFGEKVFRRLDRELRQFCLGHCQDQPIETATSFLQGRQDCQSQRRGAVATQCGAEGGMAQSSPLSLPGLLKPNCSGEIFGSFARPVTSIFRHLIIPMCDMSGSMRSPCPYIQQKSKFVTVKTASKSALTIEAIEGADNLDSIVTLLPALANWGMSTNFFGAVERQGTQLDIRGC
jgi:hypothetical protein